MSGLSMLCYLRKPRLYKRMHKFVQQENLLCGTLHSTSIVLFRLKTLPVITMARLVCLNLPRMNTGSQLSLMPCNVVKLYFPNNRLVSSSIWKGNIHNSGPFIAELKGYFILEWLVSGHSDLTLQSGPLQRSNMVVQDCYLTTVSWITWSRQVT